MGRFWARALLLPALVLAAGCGDDGPTGPSDITGTYVLDSVLGESLPVTVQETADLHLELLGSVLEVSAGGTFTETSSYRETTAAGAELFDEVTTGTWTHSGTRVTFSTTDGNTLEGTVSATRLTLVASLVFLKQ
jgi:hypothetical protein